MIKRFSIIFCCFALALFFSFTNPPDLELIQTMAVPVSSKTIVIDAGHGIPDEGAEKYRTKATEFIRKQLC